MVNSFKPDLLAGRVALVTGASNGLGRHFAHVLAEAGAHVIAAARSEARLEELRGELEGAGLSCETAVLDVTDPASIATIALRHQAVDILVNNAGIARAGAALNQTPDDWDVVLDTNLKGTFFLSQAVAKVMKGRGQGGAIVNIASIAGIRQNAGVAPYAISKAGVVQMTKVLALEFARFGVRVNAIAPGSFPTEITGDYWQSEAGQATIGRIPQRRLGAYGDLDGPLLLLASDLSSYMTGAVLVVDGGHAVASL